MNYNPQIERQRETDFGARPHPGNGHAADASIGVLLKELANEVPSLVRKEVALAKSEMRESMQATKAGVAAVATGGAVAMTGLIVLAMAAVYALSEVLVPWLAALIVGAVALLIGYAMVQAGKKRFEAESIRPDRTMNTLHKDVEAMRGRKPS